MKNKFPISKILITLLILFIPQRTIADHPHEEDLPHQDDPAPIQHEHLSLFDLVEHEDATHRSVNSGDWDDPATWENGEIPNDLPSGEFSRVLISENTDVFLDFVNGTVHKTIRVDGKLKFSTTENTGLLVDTLVIDPAGKLEIGTQTTPVETGVRAKIIIADTGDIDIDWDPLELSRGLISHGQVTIHGEVKTSHIDLQRTPAKREKALFLAELPVNWHVGDVLVLPGNHSRRDFDEILIITNIVDNRIDVAALSDDGSINERWRGFRAYRHRVPDDLVPFVINLSRNVVVESQNIFHADESGINRRRGHVMFMHSGAGKTDTRYVGAYGLGRTDKRTPLESPEIDPHGSRVPDTGHNAVGRYAWHFHRGGPQNAAAIVQGLAIVDSPGLGLVNHSSNVHVSDSSAYNVVGSAWFTEVGDEIGSFENVAAVRMIGSGEGIESRRDNNGGVILETDFGHSGHGFWLQGAGVKLRNVRVTGAGDAGIIFFTVPLEETDIGVARFQASLLDDPSIANGRETVPVGVVPLELDGALVYGCRTGVETKFHQLSSSHDVRSVITNVTTARTSTAFSIRYTNQLTISDSTFIGYKRRPARRSAMRRNNVTRSIIFDDLNIKWWGHGLSIPVNGHNIVRDGVYQNIRDINICTTRDDDRVIDIEGNVEFLDLTEKQLASYRRGPIKKYQIYLWTKFNPDMNDLTRLFARDIIRMGTMIYDDHQLFYHAQAADFIPFTLETAADYVPQAIIGLSNSELWNAYGLAIGDAIAPEDAFIDPVIHALIGDPIDYAPKVRLANRKYINKLTDYRFQYYVYGDDGSRTRIRVPGFVDLAEGWNFLTTEVDDYKRTFLVFGDIIPPVFVPNLNLETVINPADLKRGFVVAGDIVDNSFGEKHFKKKFKGSVLTNLPILFRTDGTQYVKLAFEIRDFARNKTPVVFELTLDENEPLAHVKKRKKLAPRKVSKALLHLLGLDGSSGTV